MMQRTSRTLMCLAAAFSIAAPFDAAAGEQSAPPLLGAEPASPPPAASPVPATEPMPPEPAKLQVGAIATLTLNSGRVLRGKIVAETEDDITMDLLTGDTVRVVRRTIRSVSQGASSTNDVVLSNITLTDGQSLRGKLVAETEDGVTVELLSGGTMMLARSSIRSISQEKAQVANSGEVWFRDPNRTRYFYAPSAMMLKQGEGYFSQKELFFSALAYGITDNVSVLVGSALPALLIPGGYGLNLIGALKVGFSPAENFHLAAGAESLVLPTVGGFGFVFGSMTVGNPNAHLTVSGGYPFAYLTTSGSASFVGDALFVVAGDLRVGSNFAFVTENWIMPSFRTSSVFTLDALGGRIFGDRWAVDLGMIFIPTTGILVPIPWADFTWNFGG